MPVPKHQHRAAAILVLAPKGSLGVSVAAGRFADIAGNANTAAANASKDYSATQTISFTGPGNQTIGTFIPLRCTKVVFAAGSLVFVQAN